MSGRGELSVSCRSKVIKKLEHINASVINKMENAITTDVKICAGVCECGKSPSV